MKKFWAARPGWKAIAITLVVCLALMYFGLAVAIWLRLLLGVALALLVIVQLTIARLHPELYEDANAAIYRTQRDKLFNGLQPLVQAVEDDPSATPGTKVVAEQAKAVLAEVSSRYAKSEQ
jgi:hypothetical protein